MQPGITEHLAGLVSCRLQKHQWTCWIRTITPAIRPRMGTYNGHFNRIEVQEHTDWLTQRHTNTATLCCPVGPLRSSLMNIISVYRKQAFITSSRLASRHSELHRSAHIHTCVHTYCCTLPHISSCLHCPLLSDWFRGPSSFVWPPLAQLVFISFSDLSLCLLQMLSISELLCVAFWATSACWPPSVSNQSAIKIHTQTLTTWTCILCGSSAHM